MTQDFISTPYATNVLLTTIIEVWTNQQSYTTVVRPQRVRPETKTKRKLAKTIRKQQNKDNTSNLRANIRFCL